MRAGLLSEKISLIVPTYSQDNDYSEQTVTWSEGTVIRADVTSQSSSRALANGNELVTGIISVTVRYSQTITERCRIIWRGNTYRITSCVPYVRQGRMDITAEKLEDE